MQGKMMQGKMMQPMKMMNKIMRTSPLDAVITTQKDYMDSFKSVQGKIDSVSKALLKWSYLEPNPSLAQAFSCWADLDHAYGQLLVQLCDKGIGYRQVFKDIRDQGIELSKVKQEKNKAASDVTSAVKKVEDLRKSKKVNQPKIDSAEAELQLAKNRDEEMTEVLRVKSQEFEEYKAKTIKGALINYSNEYLEALSTLQMIFQTKKEMGEMMSEKPVYERQEMPNGNSKVDAIFQKLDLELPMRDAALDRLQINRTVSAPPLRKTSSPTPQPKISVHELTSRHFPATASSEGRPKTMSMVYKTDFSESDDDDDDCYEYPEDPSPIANKSMTLPANMSSAPPRLPAPNPGAKPELTRPAGMARLPPNAVALPVQPPPKLPQRGRALSNENDVSDGEDDHEYQYPEESFGSSNPSISTAAAEEEEEYIVPNHEPLESQPPSKASKSKSERIENQEHLVDNQSGAVYFEVEEKNPSQTRLPPGISTPDVCPVNHPSPPEDVCIDDDYYGNISVEEANKLGLAVESNRNSNASNGSDNRKPAVLPKPKGNKSPQVAQKSAGAMKPQDVQGEEEGDVYVLSNIPGNQGGTDENSNQEIDEGETYDMVCVDGGPSQVYGNVEFLESKGIVSQMQQHLLGADASDKGPMPTPRKEKISHTYFNPERKEDPKRQPPRSPLPSRPK